MNSERVLQSQLPLKDVPSLSLSAHLLSKLMYFKDKTLIVDCLTGCLWSGKEIYECCLSIADAFINLFDLNSGETVCFWCPNSDVHAIGFLATISSGANYLAIDPNSSYEEVYKQIKMSSGKFLVCVSSNLSQSIQLRNSLETLKSVFIIGGDSNLEERNCHLLMTFMSYKSEADSLTKPVPIPVPVNEDNICVINFIKQTKEGIVDQLVPVIKTNANLIHSVTQLNQLELIELNGDQTLIGQHFSNYFGLILFCHTIVTGNTIALNRNHLNKQETMQYLSKYNISCASIDLKELLYLLRNDVEIRSSAQNSSKLYHDFSTLTDILYSGPPLPHSDSLTEEIFRKIRPKYFRAVYGKPETGVISFVWKSLSTFETKSSEKSYYNSGYVVPGVEVKIIHPKTEKSRLNNKIGEICVKSKQIIDKSLNLAVLTRNAFTIDGFFRTGDAGYYDSEGLLYVECRVDECIYEGNEIINPSTLETILLKHPSVKEVAVIGVPDRNFGQICCAFVALNPKQSVSEVVLNEFLANRGKQLRAGIKFIERIPRTLRSKPNRMALKVIYNEFHTFSSLEML